MAGRLRTLIITRHLTGVGLSLSSVTCETSQVMLAGVQDFFSLGSPVFAPPD